MMAEQAMGVVVPVIMVVPAMVMASVVVMLMIVMLIVSMVVLTVRVVVVMLGRHGAYVSPRARRINAAQSPEPWTVAARPLSPPAG